MEGRRSVHCKAGDCFRGNAEAHATDLAAGYSVIYDATSLSSGRRRELLRAVSVCEPETVCVILDTPLEICLERNEGRTRKVPEYVIRNMAKRFDRAGFSEGWDRIDLVRPSTSRLQST